ncbi:LLM class oxidoreductase [Staphylococcus simulans]|uniref:Phthiodiolone/phenolphthiodiolone dimycocerosates ketoreductase n=1 Tax=Staphylococcus simulans TaxID=1286 RepID=A0A6N3FNC9_STASI|nr:MULTISPECIES: LLM class oxidoreductase [Staphylococcus]MBU6944258.1 LLM class oxidoreductase [Staphylococcus sp. CWZ226]EKS26635.1 BA3436 family luciferase-type oxidoreductase [Staphylococcus simulans ACS-120-V-Sch1]MBO0387195.1 LLM class oxidoreductase [Staphylococcus simulans]MDK8174399.1 LLM class oxidoreductase [Staphylococcus simulans]MDN6656505.1 LLM class oxidoreductase [Staphylococcus simulans]
MTTIEQHNGFKRTFQKGHLTLGLSIPFDNSEKIALSFDQQAELAQYAEELGFTSLFVRDNPLYSPHLGPVTTNYDPFVFLTYLSAKTNKIALGTASIVATLRHPIHVAKAAATLDLVSNERFLMGLATGDRSFEFPAFKVEEKNLHNHFRDAVSSLNALWQDHSPNISNSIFELYEDSGLQVLPKHHHIPIFATGNAKQDLDWIKENMDGWMFYPQEFQMQKALLQAWHDNDVFKPFMHPLALDLSKDPNEKIKPIKGGYRLGRNTLINVLKAYERIGTNHIMLKLVTHERTYQDIMKELGDYVIPHFPPNEIKEEQ